MGSKVSPDEEDEQPDAAAEAAAVAANSSTSCLGAAVMLRQPTVCPGHGGWVSADAAPAPPRADLRREAAELRWP